MNDTTSTPDADFEAAMQAHRDLVARVRTFLEMSKWQRLDFAVVRTADLEALLAEVER